MIIHQFTDALPEPLAHTLGAFERQFSYPLGPGRSFHIEHGEDYPRFFRAMGTAACFVAEKRNAITGVLSVAIRPLQTPEGDLIASAYVGDLKVATKNLSGIQFLRLARSALEWGRPQAVSAYGIVMDGTRRSPRDYTGRLGLPAFLEVAAIQVVRLPAIKDADGEEVSRWRSSPPRAAEELFTMLSRRCFVPLGGDPAERSETLPTWLVEPDGQACGRLEDTRRAKRLVDSDGREMLSMHLACAGWKSPAAAARLFRTAQRLACDSGFEGVFVAVDAREWEAIAPLISVDGIVVAPATVYGVGVQPGRSWKINSSEI